ncbi:hypothetical protein QAD02_005956 [Eretmocerus hayati]|uniref:Uncharacterized protein n=1 Tax=Eretmocerus hayati TaxID=131215 RepID=A0ACC2N1W9_9HYME|nr:hypothetical protein QAD02_005956 [Eretmocerus hayati]
MIGPSDKRAHYSSLYTIEMLICCSCGREKTEIVRILIAAGANVNVSDSMGFPVIHTAILKGYNEIAKILIQNGCSLAPSTWCKSTPLHSAVIASAKKCNNTELIEYLLMKGVDPNLEDKHGDTPLSHRPSHLQKLGAKLPKQYIDALLVIVKHLAICDAKKSLINMKNVAAMLQNKALNEYFASCQKELILMKKTDIGSKITYFKLLVGSDNDLYMSVDEPQVQASFQSDNYKHLFPIYHSLLLEKYNRGLQISDEIDQPSCKKPRLSQ